MHIMEHRQERLYIYRLRPILDLETTAGPAQQAFNQELHYLREGCPSKHADAQSYQMKYMVRGGKMLFFQRPFLQTYIEEDLEIQRARVLRAKLELVRAGEGDCGVQNGGQRFIAMGPTAQAIVPDFPTWEYTWGNE